MSKGRIENKEEITRDLNPPLAKELKKRWEGETTPNWLASGQHQNPYAYTQC